MAQRNKEIEKSLVEVIAKLQKHSDVLYQAGLVDPNEMRLTIEGRQQVAKKLAEKGVSQRKIAAVTGVDRSTVRRDLGLIDPKSGSKRPGNDVDPEASAVVMRAKFAALDMPTAEEADRSYQDTLFDQACLLLESMADETRRRFFAFLMETYRETALKNCA